MAVFGKKRGTGSQVALASAAPQLLLPRPSPKADFLSQLIAEHQHLPLLRQHRQAPVTLAVNAYATGSRIAVRRMPAGYRTTIIA